MPATEIPCCVDVPAAEGLLRYGLTELMRGLGLTPRWVRRDDARLVLAKEVSPSVVGATIQDDAVDALVIPAPVSPSALGWMDMGGVRWPVPVLTHGSAGVGDLAAATAWWLAGIQEVVSTERDRHGRFPYAQSLQAALGDAPGGPLRPAVDAYRGLLADTLREAGVDVTRPTWGGAPWAIALTHDLDAVRTRRVRAALGSLARGQPAEALRRALGPDRRRESIRDLRDLSERHSAAATWFVKPAAWTSEDIPGGLDQALVRRLKDWASTGHEIGWHPGYGTLGRPDRLAAERELFAEAIGFHPRVARTHFLRWTPGETARHLVDAGVEIDSTLGFAEHEGFRRGTALPFPLYDLDRDRVSDLWEVPLAVMDTTLAEYRHLPVAEMGAAIRRVFDAARVSNGIAVVLWHNQVGADTDGWASCVDALDREIGQARAQGAAVGSLGALTDAWRGEARERSAVE